MCTLGRRSEMVKLETVAPFLRIRELYRILAYKKIKARNSRAKKGKSPYRTLFVEHWIMLIHGESLRHKRKVCVLTCPKNKYRSYNKEV